MQRLKTQVKERSQKHLEPAMVKNKYKWLTIRPKNSSASGCRLAKNRDGRNNFKNIFLDHHSPKVFITQLSIRTNVKNKDIVAKWTMHFFQQNFGSKVLHHNFQIKLINKIFRDKVFRDSRQLKAQEFFMP